MPCPGTSVGTLSTFHIHSECPYGSKELHLFCQLGEAEEAMMKQAFVRFGFTARTYHKVLKVARTIADLAGSEMIQTAHLCEAIGYRTPDKKYWKR